MDDFFQISSSGCCEDDAFRGRAGTDCFTGIIFVAPIKEFLNMKFRIRYAEQIVGLFILIAIISVAGLLILMSANQRWFSKDYRFTSTFESGNNLSIGMAVRLKGFRIGGVDSISLLQDNSVQIGFHIYDSYYEKVTPNSVLELAVSPIGLGGGGLLFHPGISPGPPIPEGAEIPSLDTREGRELVLRGLVAIPARSDAVSDILVKVGPTIDSVNMTLGALETLLLSVDDLMHDRNDSSLGGLLKEANLIAGNVEEITYEAKGNIEAIMGDVAALTAGASREADLILGNIADLTESLADTTGIVTRLLDPKGSIPKILDDNEELYLVLSEILQSLSVSAKEIELLLTFANRKQPQITALLDQTIDAINEGRDVMTGLKNNPLLRGGIPEPGPQSTTFGGLREGEF
jgi:phospholipid/cholesterol/gamma-HCH transport system substrate-binding protein